MIKIKNQKIMTDQKIGNLLLLTLKIESQLKCILKNILPNNINLCLNRPFSKATNYIFNFKDKNSHLEMVKKSLSLYGKNIDNFSIGAITYLINITNFKKLITKKYNYFFINNIEFVINNLNLICAIRNKLSHPRCKFNITEKEFIKIVGHVEPIWKWNYQRMFKRLCAINKILNKILKK